MAGRGKRFTTIRGYDFGAVTSSMQKAIRRADPKLAGYFAMELIESGYGEYVWRRLLTISAEDVFEPMTREIMALYLSWKSIRQAAAKKEREPKKGRIFAAKAVLLLCRAAKSRDADHLTNLVYDRKLGLTDEQIEAAVDEGMKHREEIPDYAFDVHTDKGRARGKTKRDFFMEEHAALKPRVQGELDGILEKYR